jgi:hypothetical protein
MLFPPCHHPSVGPGPSMRCHVTLTHAQPGGHASEAKVTTRAGLPTPWGAFPATQPQLTPLCLAVAPVMGVCRVAYGVVHTESTESTTRFGLPVPENGGAPPHPCLATPSRPPQPCTKCMAHVGLHTQTHTQPGVVHLAQGHRAGRCLDRPHRVPLHCLAPPCPNICPHTPHLAFGH